MWTSLRRFPVSAKPPKIIILSPYAAALNIWVLSLSLHKPVMTSSFRWILCVKFLPNHVVLRGSEQKKNFVPKSREYTSLNRAWSPKPPKITNLSCMMTPVWQYRPSGFSPLHFTSVHVFDSYRLALTGLSTLPRSNTWTSFNFWERWTPPNILMRQKWTKENVLSFDCYICQPRGCCEGGALFQIVCPL